MNSIRLIKETMKYSSPQDILLRYSLVSKGWKAVADDDEVWRCLYLGDKPGFQTDEDFKEIYRRNCKKELYYVYYSTLLVLGLKNQNWSVRNLQSRMLTAYCPRMEQISPDRLVYIDFSQRGNNCFLISAKEGSVIPLHKPVLQLDSPGISHYESKMFIFGGNIRSPSNYCWMMDVDTGRGWTRLEINLEKRYNFTPCLYVDDIYLVGGYDALKEEKFNARTYKVERVPIVLPFMTDTLCCVYRNELIILQCGAVSRVKLNEREKKLRTRSIDFHRQPPLEVKAVAFENKICFLDLSHKELVGLNLSWNTISTASFVL